MLMNRRDLILALLVVMVWGSSFTAMKLGLNDLPPMLLTSFRYLLAALPAIFFIRAPTVSARYWVTYGIAVGIGQFGCLFYALHIGMPAGPASVILQAQAFFTLIFASLFLRERVMASQVLGLVLASIGLYIIGYYTDNIAAFIIPLNAFLLTLTGAAFWGMSNILVRQASQDSIAQGKQLDMLSLVVWSSLIPPIPLFLLAFIFDTPETIMVAISSMSGTSMLAILYLAFGATLFGFGIWSNLLSKYP
ncbi:EamA family transporter, partial [Candidatus Pacearchaeota archaeon]|nr:EamA family transporter [Candidatus Pacearchaeota archaeon]